MGDDLNNLYYFTFLVIIVIILIPHYIQVNKITIQMTKRGGFLNGKQKVQLPSNLLQLKKRQDNQKYQNQHFRQTRMSEGHARYYRTNQFPTSIGEKNIKDKQALYKRLTNIRQQNKQIRNLSFSNMLKRMVVLDQDHFSNMISPSLINNPLDQRMKRQVGIQPLHQKVFNMECTKSNTASRAPSRSIDFDEQKKPSKRLFKKFYLPSSQATQSIFLESVDPTDKYIYRDGKKVECKRIHNFYTSHMFRNGYDKYYRKTISSFNVPV